MTLSMTVLLTAFPVMLVLFKGVRVRLHALGAQKIGLWELQLERQVARKLIALFVSVLWAATVPILPLRTLVSLVKLEG